MAQWLERGVLPLSLPVVRFRTMFLPSQSWDNFRCCVHGQGTSPSNASLDQGENEYLVGQRWQCER